ncbi:hypothetical protein PR202_ga28331 [Eleusine coracana subsp. coracana]|uniref:At1g61320/AtMIF1 LRR domain-containing protein n=1 Tax=Eleusine coracana subsp. coracana TaxID=191504 RepID=A0AAV5DIW9_ELECO|nr:hypothetical protein PR202_ga28331 [Eleusine coracana subsp. coracana]
MRAVVLSTRWRHLPWFLTQLNIDVKDFFHKPYADFTVDEHIEIAMSSLTESIRRMLAPTRRNSVITRFCVSLFLINSYSSEIGLLINEAIESEMVKEITITSGVERLAFDVSKEEIVKHADRVNSFFYNYPNISCCLTSLRLYNASFAESDMHNLHANSWTQLRLLYLYQCDTGFGKSFKIDAPNSKLKVLEFCHCACMRVEFVCLPELELLICGYWSTPYLPFTLGSVPCLKEVEIYSATESYQEPFKLSELLCGKTCINALMLDYLGEKIWLQAEKNQVRSAFSNLRELSLFGIFVGFGLLWTIAFLEAAPALEILDIEVSDHICHDEEERKETYGERTNVSWDVSDLAGSFKPLPLRTLQLRGFNATEEHIVFIGAVMKRASNLHTVILEELYCKQCSAISTNECKFPKNDGEREVVMNKLRNRFSSRAHIVFRDHKPSGD